VTPTAVDSPVARFARGAVRAEALAARTPAGREPLAFAAGLFRAQQVLAAAIERIPLTGNMEADRPAFAADLDGVVGFAAERGPAGLRDQARTFGSSGGDPLAAFWNGGGSGRQDYLARALLQPYAGVLAARGLRPDRGDPAGGCPFCGGLPWIALRRSGPTDMDGAQRFLGCALCGGTWPINRISCPACDEQSPERLPCFQSDRHPSARIEACASCGIYLKSIDLTVDALAVPEVDDLCSLSLDLWAQQEGHRRLEPGLAGV
jgi:formate dehydrogenase maturation protein FdhE